MHRLVGGILLVTVLGASGSAQAPPARLDPYLAPAEQLIAAARADQFAWNRLAELTDTFGPRFTGSPNLERAIEWAAATMKQDGLDNVRLEPVTVPRWVRGQESLEILAPQRDVIPMLGLGGSIATPPAGVEAEVLVVSSGDDLNRRAADAKGRIVLFNVPYTSYGETVQYRANGASMAARHGAVGMLVRAVGPIGHRTPHTGGMAYAADAPRIPAAAISVEDAQRLQRLAARGVTVRVRLKMEARFDPDGESFNVVGELPGRERPAEIVLVGCHFDSWDVGTGASDDAVGCIVTWEAVRLMKALNIRPRRTVRLVLFTNEENGLRGANSYRDRYRADAANHVFALESDSGVFAPARLGFSGTEAARTVIHDIAALLAPIGMQTVINGGGGADIGPIAALGKVPTMAYAGDATRYFTIHHTPADTIDRIDPKEVSTAAASIAAMVYVIADMPQSLPK
jgi:carboxypeptidase Q